MSFMESISKKWDAFMENSAPTREKVGSFFRKVGNTATKVWDFAVKFKQFILAIPVALGAVILAIRNMSALPKQVGFGLQIDGTFDFVVGRGIAVLGPIAITALCLLLMFCSKRVLTPWLVSVFSLVLPLLLWIINCYPA
ncbi:MAG: hypothetical protein IJZ15_00815 [Oscillospiraceae bacterium]|nr:hypothetical protein [Oscillospiraceae bacterium]